MKETNNSMNSNIDTIFGINLTTAYDLDLEKKYELVRTNTNYLKNTTIEEVKDIKFSIFKDIIILLKTNKVYVNGEEKADNIKYLHFVDGMSIFAIDNENRLFCLTASDNAPKLINNNDYRYKRIILTPLCIVALTYEKGVKCFGNFLDIFIDYNKFSEVEDIGYEESNDDIIVIKNNNIYSLFGNFEYSNSDSNIIYCEKGKDIILDEVMMISN